MELLENRAKPISNILKSISKEIMEIHKILSDSYSINECLYCGCKEYIEKSGQGYSDVCYMPMEYWEVCKDCGLEIFKDPTKIEFFKFLKDRGWEYDTWGKEKGWLKRIRSEEGEYKRIFILGLIGEGFFGDGTPNRISYYEDFGDRKVIQADEPTLRSLKQIVVDLEIY